MYWIFIIYTFLFTTSLFSSSTKKQFFQLPFQKQSANNYCIINRSNGNINCGDNQINQLVYENPDDFRNKKLITISPGGFKGFYMLGVTTYMKTFFHITGDEYIYSGSSAGAWNALVLSYRGEPYRLFSRIRNIISIVNRDFKKGSIYDMKKHMRTTILNNFCDDEFDLSNIFIGVTTKTPIQKKSFKEFIFPPKTHLTLYTGFNNLSDVIDACIASSHVPFITTKNFHHKYCDIESFDGGFSNNPYLNINTPYFSITPDIWDWEKKERIRRQHKNKGCLLKYLDFVGTLESFTTLLSKNKYDLLDLFERGFIDSFENQFKLRNKFSIMPDYSEFLINNNIENIEDKI